MDTNCLATITALMAFVGVPVGILFRALREENAYLKKLLERALEVQEGQTEVSRDLVETTKRRHR